MSLNNPSDPINPAEAREGTVEDQSNITSQSAGEVSQPADQAAEQASPADSEAQRRRILIGSQRNPAGYRTRPRDWAPVDEGGRHKQKGGGRKAEGGPKPAQLAADSGQSLNAAQGMGGSPPIEPANDTGPGQLRAEAAVESPQQRDAASSAPPPLPARVPAPSKPAIEPVSRPPLPPPNLRDRPSPDLEDELNQAMGDASMDELMGGKSAADEPALEPDSLQSGRVVGIRRDDVFVEFGGRQQGIVSMRLFDVPPQPGAIVQVVVRRFNPEDEMYELSLPNKAVQVDDWSDLVEGALVEVHVTGVNTGGLACEVNHIRGFIPVSQIALYRVEDLAPFVDQRLTCVITESDPDRRNLIVSRRAVLEREREQAREQLLATLQPGQIHEGVVRKLMDFGAFVDIGGIDGLIHISQLAWSRVKHPSEVLKEGQTVKVRIEKVDAETGKIGLTYRDLFESPWANVSQKFPPTSIVRGTVTKLMEFGAFVELEPGIEGLIHISELSHKRIWRAADVVHEGDQVEVLVLSVDAEAQRISLSMKALATAPEPAKKEDAAGEASAAKPSKKQHAKPTGPLLGGLTRAGGDRFGLKW